MNDILFSPYLKQYKTPLGALFVYEDVVLKIRITKKYKIYNLQIVVSNDDGEVFRKPLNISFEDDLQFIDYNLFTVTFNFETPYLYWYHFEFDDCYGHHYIGRNDAMDAVLTDCEVSNFQINVTEITDSNFDWYQGKVMYQIFPDRFYKAGNNPQKDTGFIHQKWDEPVKYKPIKGLYSNDFYGGDFQGIIEKLPYLKTLNVSVIYLNPIFLSPSNHRYNTSDYLQIDPMLGTEEDFKLMIEKGKELGISFIIDGVYNHTGDDSIYFNRYNNFDSIGAYQSKNSSYYNWYRFKKYPNDYEAWWGIKDLPAVNQNSSFVEFITGDNGVLDKWMKFGIKGVRLDVVDELNTDFLQKITKRVKSHDKDALIIGEVWEDASNKIAYTTRRTYFNGKELDSVMNYPLKDAIISYLNYNFLNDLVNTMRNIINNHPKKVLNSLMNILSTHDTARAISAFSKVNFHTLSKDELAAFKMTQGEYYNARSKLKMAFALLYTLPGVPCIFYGDECGVEGYKDPFCRQTMPWDKGDKELTKYLIKLGDIRNNPVFIDGEYNEEIIDDRIFAFSRVKNNQKFVTIVNNSHYNYYYKVESARDVINDVEVINGLSIDPQTAVILNINKIL